MQVASDEQPELMIDGADLSETVARFTPSSSATSWTEVRRTPYLTKQREAASR